jgi:hypothetical protein
MEDSLTKDNLGCYDEDGTNYYEDVNDDPPKIEFDKKQYSIRLLKILLRYQTQPSASIEL